MQMRFSYWGEQLSSCALLSQSFKEEMSVTQWAELYFHKRLSMYYSLDSTGA